MQSFEDFLTESARIDTERWEGSNGKKPSGSGSWMFSVKKDPSGSELSDPDVTFSSKPNSSYADAKKQAISHFKDAVVIYLLP